MKLTRDDVYVLGRNTVDRIRERYYRENGPDKSGVKLMDDLISELTRVRDMYAEIEIKDEVEDEDIYI